MSNKSRVERTRVLREKQNSKQSPGKEEPAPPGSRQGKARSHSCEALVHFKPEKQRQHS